jgi:type II secretory pathway pseudopilin PulG
MRKSRGGFTLIELSLSLIFIAILSLTVVFLIQNISASYRRGLILNQVNTIGMDLVDDFRISIQNASSDPVTRMCEIYYPFGSDNRKKCIDDKAMSFVSVTKTAQVKVGGKFIGTNGAADDSYMPVFGALCTGTYTYIWNTGYFENADGYEGNLDNNREVVDTKPAVLGIKTSATENFEPKYENFRLLKVYDSERTICVNAMRDQNDSWGESGKVPNYVASTSVPSEYRNERIKNEFVISENMLNTAGADEGIVDLMKKHNAADLVLYELYVSPPALSQTRQNLFYAASFILGTRRGGINIKEAGNNCKPPSDDFSELEYCAINKFNFAVMAGGK